ncbi:MAG TPA: hypothetical protein VFD66_04095 [Verrucomicrobiae bacterium]|nr:hypothetical protein [Verrucomicrobiae bacterium]
MKKNKSTTGVLFITLAALCGCATQSGVVVTETVGPSGPAPQSQGTTGRLIVYTATEVPAIVGSRHPTHSAYQLYAADGKRLRWVDNRAGSFYQDPVALDVPPGRYEVKGRATNSGNVSVPVLIEAGRTTVVDLEGSALSENTRYSRQNLVRLPDGQAIGLEATDAGAKLQHPN